MKRLSFTELHAQEDVACTRKKLDGDFVSDSGRKQKRSRSKLLLFSFVPHHFWECAINFLFVLLFSPQELNYSVQLSEKLCLKNLHTLENCAGSNHQKAPGSRVVLMAQCKAVEFEAFYFITFHIQKRDGYNFLWFSVIIEPGVDVISKLPKVLSCI